MKSFDEAVCARVVSSRFNVPDTQKLREFSEKRGLKLWSPICSENLGYAKVRNPVGEDSFRNCGSGNVLNRHSDWPS